MNPWKKSQDIINELMVSLNPEAGEIATNLYSLYDYMQRRLIEANLKKEIEPVKEVKKNGWGTSWNVERGYVTGT